MDDIPASERHYPPGLRTADLVGRTRVRSVQTLEAYRKRYAQLLAACKRETGAEVIGALALARFVRAKAPILRHSSYRQYVAAALQFARDLFDRGMLTAEDAELVAKTLRIERTGDEKPFLPASAPPRTSAKRAKKISEEALARVVKGAVRTNTRTAAMLAGVVHFGAKLGLRPSEWMDAHLDGGVLVVRSAKYSIENQRGLAEDRRLFLVRERFSARDMANLRMTLGLIQREIRRASGDHWKVLRRLSRMFTKLGAEVGLKRATLRVLRHQARSNLAAAGLDTPAIAGVLGHASEASQVAYGHARSGWGEAPCVVADPALVAKVRPGASLSSKMRRGEALNWREFSERQAAAPAFSR